jgi:hypothetical protein
MKNLPILLLITSIIGGCVTTKPDCSLIGVDQSVTYRVNKHCELDVFREWTVVDWCKYNGKSKGLWVVKERISLCESLCDYPTVPKKVKRIQSKSTI